jgi:hypothetical protein
MIAHRTFSGVGGKLASGIRKTQREVRAQAEAFLAESVDPDDVISITESAVPSTFSQCLVSVTIWYRKE